MKKLTILSLAVLTQVAFAAYGAILPEATIKTAETKESTARVLRHLNMGNIEAAKEEASRAHVKAKVAHDQARNAVLKVLKKVEKAKAATKILPVTAANKKIEIKALVKSHHAENKELTEMQASEKIAKESKEKAQKHAEADAACQAKKNHANEVHRANTEKHTAMKHAKQNKNLEKKHADEAKVQALVYPFYPIIRH